MTEEEKLEESGACREASDLFGKVWNKKLSINEDKIELVQFIIRFNSYFLANNLHKVTKGAYLKDGLTEALLDAILDYTKHILKEEVAEDSNEGGKTE